MGFCFDNLIILCNRHWNLENKGTRSGTLHSFTSLIKICCLEWKIFSSEWWAVWWWMRVVFIILILGWLTMQEWLHFKKHIFSAQTIIITESYLNWYFPCRYCIISLLQIYYGSFSAMTNMHVYRRVTFLRNSTSTLPQCTFPCPWCGTIKMHLFYDAQ